MTLDWPTLLPLIFAGLMGLAILVYVILDGFDLGIGILFAAAERRRAGHDDRRDRPVLGRQRDLAGARRRPAAGRLSRWRTASSSPRSTFRSSLLLVGLILRGVAFDFRAKVPARHKQRWNRIFFAGSLIASLAQGYMLGIYVLGLDCRPRRHRLRRAGGALPCRRLCGDGRGLADLQDGRRIAEEGGAVAAPGAGADRARHGRRLARHAARQSAHLRQMVRLAGHALSVAAADPVGGAVRLAVAADLPSAQGRTTATRCCRS